MNVIQKWRRCCALKPLQRYSPARKIVKMVKKKTNERAILAILLITCLRFL